MFSTRSGAAKLSLGVVIALVGLKVAVGAITGSLSVLAQATDSFLDLIAISITFLAIRIAVKPADREHPFGHGKVENVAAVVQAVLIFTAGGLIIYSAVLRIIAGTAIELTEAGMAVMLVSIFASIFLSRHLNKVAKSADSLALEANAHNIAADVYSAVAVLVGLIVVRFTGLSIIDPIIAMLVSLFIIKVAFDVLRKSFGGLMDQRLPEEEENTIRLSIMEHGYEVVGFHKLRTRKSGNQRYVDLHIVMPKEVSIEDAHRLCDHLEEDIRDKLRQVNVTIHVEPCREECAGCYVICDIRKTER